MSKTFSFLILLILSFSSQAAVRTGGDGQGQMLQRLQRMVRQATQERDLLKTENAKLQAELAELKKNQQTLEAEKNQVSKKLSGARSQNQQLQSRQQQTYDKLVEVVEKYKVLRQQALQLQAELKSSQKQYQQTSEQLDLCSQHNAKLISAANELLERYQNKGTLSGLLQSEGVLQFTSVEMENIIQQYEDKIRDEEYHKPVSANE